MPAADDQLAPNDDDASLRAELESVSAALVLEQKIAGICEHGSTSCR